MVLDERQSFPYLDRTCYRIRQPGLLEMGLDYLEAVNHQLDLNYEKEVERYERLALAGMKKNDLNKQKPKDPDYIDFDFENFNLWVELNNYQNIFK